MNSTKRTVMAVLLAAVMVLSLAACGSGSAKSEGAAPEAAAAQTYENGGMKLTVPAEYAGLVTVETAKDNMLFSVSETASIEADKAQGGSGDGAGWLFGVGVVSREDFRQMLCYDMSGVEAFAADADENHYVLYHPTDVRYVRESYEGMGDESNADWKQWTMLNEWANGVPAAFIAENDGLTAESFGNSEIEMYLFRAAFQPDVKYTISTLEYGPQEPNGVDEKPYVVALTKNVRYEYADNSETPDGEYVVLAFPDDDYRFDFFFAEKNYVRMVWNNGENEQLYRAVFADDTNATDVMNEWYHALVDANGGVNTLLGYTADDLIGRWAEKQAGRGLITITAGSEADVYDVRIEWSSSAFEQVIWEMTATAGEGGVISYENGKKTIRTYESETKYTDAVQYENGAGRFFLNSAHELMWEDDVDHAGDDTAFVNVD